MDIITEAMKQAKWSEWKVPPPSHFDDSGFWVEGFPEIQLIACLITRLPSGKWAMSWAKLRKVDLEATPHGVEAVEKLKRELKKAGGEALRSFLEENCGGKEPRYE